MTTKQPYGPFYVPFPNGTAIMDWRDANCDRCWKGKWSEKTGKSRCRIENALALAAATDGSLLHDGSTKPDKAAKIAHRLNWDGVDYLISNCPEREERRPKQERHKPKKDHPTLL